MRFATFYKYWRKRRVQIGDANFLVLQGRFNAARLLEEDSKWELPLPSMEKLAAIRRQP